MSKLATILSTKYYYQHKNGVDFDQNLSDFTVNLARNIGLKVKFVATIRIEWFSNADIVDTWKVEANTITRQAGNFSDDGFYIGQVFDYITDWSGNNTAPIQFNASVQNISLDGSILTFAVNSGTVVIGNVDNVGIRATAGDQQNYLTGLFYKFGIIENSDPFNFTSKITDSDSVYYADGIGLGVVRSTDFVQMNWQGTNLGGQTGAAQIRFVSNDTYTQTFEIEHIFTIVPYYLDGQLNDIKNNAIPSYLEGNNSLKHAYNLDFRLALSNPNTSISATVDNVQGSVGWFNESLNGINSNYQIDSIIYEDANSGEPVPSLQYNAKTKALITISKKSGIFNAGSRIGLYVSFLPNQDEYSNTITDFDDNFMYDIAYYTEGQTATSGTGVIKIISANIVSGNLVIDSEFEYNALQVARLDNTRNYVIGVECADVLLSNISTDSTVLLADVQTYSEQSIINGLISFPKFNFITPDKTLGVDTGVLTPLAWNETGLILDFEVKTDSTKNTIIESFEVLLVAQNQSNNSFFELDRFIFDLSSSIVSENIQQIEFDTNRGYLLQDGDNFNIAKITTGPNVLNQQCYLGAIGQKITWEDYVRNFNADHVFYDSSQPNNNLNFKASNYSNINDYEIKMLASVVVSGDDDQGVNKTGTVNNFSGTVDVFDYEKDRNLIPIWSAEIETFDESGTVNFDKSISTNVNTLFRVTWTKQGGAFSLPDYVIHRIQPVGDTGKGIFEINPFAYWQRIESNPLMPKDGFALLDVQLIGGQIVSECLIDHTKLNGLNWRLSAEIKE